MSSASEGNFQLNKNLKKNYQKASHRNRNTLSLAAAENISTNTMKDVRKVSFGLFDNKDFPELKVYGRISSESKNSELKTKSAPIVNSECKNNSIQGVTSLSDCKNIKKNAVDIIAKDNQMTETVGKNKIGLNKGKKTDCTKIPSTQVRRNPNKKKRSEPVLINFQDILLKNKVKRKTKQHNIVKKQAHQFRDKELLSGNLLDSSNPKRSRGKHREVKKKKLSNLKMTIIKERILKQKLREKQTEDPLFQNDTFNLIDSIDFKIEINNYLNELKEKKSKIIDANSKKLKDNESKEKVDSHKKEISKIEFVSKTENDLEKGNCNNNEKKIFSCSNEGVIKFSSKFREYCNNIITPDLNTAVTVFIKEIIKLQDRLFFNDPVKAKAKKRHVSGIREVKKYLTLKKVKILIIAPNLEKLQMEGSVYDSIEMLKSMAESQNVPYGFALDRYKLGKCTKKNVPVSAFGVLNYEGLETQYEAVLRQLHEAKEKFSELAGTRVEIKKDEEADDINARIISSLISSFRERLQVSSDGESHQDYIKCEPNDKD